MNLSRERKEKTLFSLIQLEIMVFFLISGYKSLYKRKNFCPYYLTYFGKVPCETNV